jgi:transcriptional regulator with XRE-family HTH domain
MMETVESVFSQLDAYIKEQGLSRRELAGKLDIPYNTVKKWLAVGKSRRNPSKEHADRIKVLLESEEKPELYRQIEEARRRTEKIKYLLLLLEDELRWFRDGNPDAREMFRKELDTSDIGYISSLLTMLSEEDKFQRWLALTTTQFQSFKRR